MDPSLTLYPVKELVISSACPETFCSHRCTVLLVDGRQGSLTLRGPEVILLKNSIPVEQIRYGGGLGRVDAERHFSYCKEESDTPITEIFQKFFSNKNRSK